MCVKHENRPYIEEEVEGLYYSEDEAVAKYFCVPVTTTRTSEGRTKREVNEVLCTPCERMTSVGCLNKSNP